MIKSSALMNCRHLQLYFVIKNKTCFKVMNKRNKLVNFLSNKRIITSVRYFITDRGCKLAQLLLNGNEDHLNASLQPSGPTCIRKESTSIVNRESVTKYNNKRQNNNPNPVQQAGEELLTESVEQQPRNSSPKKRKPIHTTAESAKVLHSDIDRSNAHSSNISEVSGCGLDQNHLTNQICDGGYKLGGNKQSDPGLYFARLQSQIHSNHKLFNAGANDTRTTEATSGRVCDVNLGVENTTGMCRPSKDFSFCYVKEDGEKTLNKSQALVTIDDTIGVGFLIKAKKEDLESAGVLFLVDATRPPSSGFIYAYIADKDSKEVANLPERTSLFDSKERLIVRSAKPLERGYEKRCQLCKSSKHKYCSYTWVFLEGSVVTHYSTTTTVTPASVAMTFSQNEHQDSHSHRTARTLSDVIIFFSLSPGDYDIILCVDTTETAGSGKGKKVMADKLTHSGIKMEVRKLQLGDFLWIAKEKKGEQRELVLDFVVERKRMDDLAGSIIDGRFKEQKFRLRSCGLKKLIYLIENYGSAEHFSVPETTLRQAIMNTQVIDGLFVKETEDVFASVEYLTLLTKQLTNLYKNKQLHAVNINDAKSLKANEDTETMLQEEEQYLMTYLDFSENTTKNKVLTVREMFAKQLMQMKGVSAERAVAIVELYPTPARLLNELEHHHDKDNMLTNIVFGKTKRKIGSAISKQVMTFFTTVS